MGYVHRTERTFNGSDSKKVQQEKTTEKKPRQSSKKGVQHIPRQRNWIEEAKTEAKNRNYVSNQRASLSLTKSVKCILQRPGIKIISAQSRKKQAASSFPAPV